MYPKMHRALTELAFKTFSSQLPETITHYKNQIVDGTKAEDNWWEPSRAWNWHFYRSESCPIPARTRWLRMHPTSECICAQRVAEMQSYPVDDPKRYAYLGRVLHHIQDMSTPSHVRPIYHGPVKRDHFEGFMEEAAKTPCFSPEIADVSITPNDDFMVIYKKAAETTIRFMDEGAVLVSVGGKATELPLSVFWESCMEHEDPKRKGFGSFGILEERFKAENKDKPITVGGKKYCIETDELHRLNNLICGRAVADTFRTLLFAGRCSTPVNSQRTQV